MVKESLKERMKKKREELKSRSQQGNIYFLKADKEVRVRILSTGKEEEFIKEVTQFFLGSDIKGVISPSTFGEPCAIQDGYEELKNSNDDDDKELAGKFPPRNKYLALCVFYKDLKGKEIDESLSPKFILLTGGTYQDIIELYLDEDEWGDMTHIEDGYDLKISRTGSGKQDTEYSVNPCKNTPTPKGFRKTYDIEKEVRSIMPSFEKTQDLINQYLGIDTMEAKPEKKKKKIIKKK